MKGNHQFTEEEAKAIKALLDKQEVSDRKERNSISAMLRSRHSFYIRDFTTESHFGPRAFDELVDQGVIKIVN